MFDSAEFPKVETPVSPEDREAARILEEARQGIVPKRGALDASKMTPTQRLEFLRDYLRTPVVERCWSFSRISDTNPECGTPGCAAGHWKHLTQQHVMGQPDLMGLSDDERDKLFCIEAGEAIGYENRPAWRVTPTDVANAIDRLLAGRAAR